MVNESMLVLSIKNLKKYYGNIHAVDGISFEVLKGEIFALLGPNGAGKTTTIKCILGLRRKDAGEIVLKGSISFVPDGKELYGSYTVEKMVKVAKELTERFDEKKCFEYVERFQIPLNEKVSSLSSGQTTQLYLSIAFSQDAELYIFDEPTWGLDPIVRNEVLEMIRELPSGDKSVLYTSHILSEVEKVADKIAIMNKGKILDIGYLDEIKEKYCAVSIPRDSKIEGYKYKSTESEDIYIVTREYAISNNLEYTPVPFEVIFEALVMGNNNPTNM
ncbi:ABC transporter ATP-binding protein [Fervidobacterium pennivorans subsp. shakshaketiis]|uniref:ABC transporter ATP-binding protein n=1 Tax=Fervidobacterium pennivorans TaxID=93466 RepID=UPI00355C7C50